MPTMSRRLLRACHLVPVLTLAAMTLPVLAGPYSMSLSQSVTRESNLLRVEEGQAVPDTLSRSDTVWTSTLQGGIDQPIGRQRVFGNASLRHSRFANNRVYDNSGYQLSAGAEGSTVERLSGSVGVTLQRSLARFSNDEVGVLTRSNIERTQQVESALRWGVDTRLAAEAMLNWRRVDFSAPEFASREFRQGGAYLGLRHTLSGALSASIGLRQSRGVYPNFRRLDDTRFEADHFQRRELEMKISANPGGSSSIDARFGLGRTRYDNATSRDLSGPFGSLDWSWRPTGRLRLQAFWSRSPSQDSYFTNTLFGRGTLSYDRVATSLQLRTDYALTAKTSLSATWGWTDRSMVRSIELGGGTLGDLRSDDRTWQYALGLRWRPTRTLLFGLDLSGDQRRHASLLSNPYRSTSINTFGQLSLD
jgi:hypothetical protein